MSVLGDPVAASSDFARLLWRHRGDRDAVPTLLLAAQRERGWVASGHMELIAALTDLPVEELRRQVAVRSDLRSEPAGDHLIQTCDGLVCHLGASRLLRETLDLELGISPGQTTPDGFATWQVVPCLGACTRAPAMAIDGQVFGPLDAEAVVAILGRLRAGEQPAGPALEEAGPSGGRVVCLCGRVLRPGRVRIPAGCCLREIVDDLGGGTATTAPLKAVLFGSRLIPASRAWEPLPPPEPSETGGHMPRIVVLDEATCMVEVMVELLAQAAASACARCTLGRLGIRRMLAITGRIRNGDGSGEEPEQLLRLGVEVATGARCGGCQAPASVVVDGLRAFRGELVAHALEGCCSAGICGARP